MTDLWFYPALAMGCRGGWLFVGFLRLPSRGACSVFGPNAGFGLRFWVPACAGTTEVFRPVTVVPGKAGSQIPEGIFDPRLPAIQLEILGPSLRWDDGGFQAYYRRPSEGWDPDSRGEHLPYWQASQSGSSMAQAFGTGAGPAAGAGAADWAGAALWLSPPPLDTAFSLLVLMVDFSVLVAARARR
ncbi:hypothetical protein ACVW0Y_003660 [Pseudomonas sp. TE3786]